MRRPDPSARPLRGQLVFVDDDREAIRVDCLLGATWDEPGAPATLAVTLPTAGGAAAAARRMLRQWAADGVPIEVTVAHERRGTVVSFSAPSGQIDFAPFDGRPRRPRRATYPSGAAG